MSCQYWPEISSSLSEIDREIKSTKEKNATQEVVDEARKKITDYLDQLRFSLERRIEKDFTDDVIYAVTASVDESMNTSITENSKLSWAPIQKDLFGAYNAGEGFFRRIDNMLDDPRIPAIVFETFFFMLKRGFQGKYRDSKTHLGKYIELLSEKIQTASVLEDQAEQSAQSDEKKRRFEKKHYYYMALGSIAGLYLLMYIISNWG